MRVATNQIKSGPSNWLLMLTTLISHENDIFVSVTHKGLYGKMVSSIAGCNDCDVWLSKQYACGESQNSKLA